jgi:adenine-specific DNA-methyltransferase
MNTTYLESKSDFLIKIESSRMLANTATSQSRKSQFGQYMTPSSIAFFMASLFPQSNLDSINLLDPGAGVGSLLSAFTEKVIKENPNIDIHIDAFEIETAFLDYLSDNLKLCETKFKNTNGNFSSNIINDDFLINITDKIFLSESLWAGNLSKYTHCIMNPPYKKILTNSNHRKKLRSIGFDTVNLYSAFLYLGIRLLKESGSLVAIIPRSFCNGPYYRSLREQILQDTSIKHIHIFEKRDKLFKDNDVLQENVIIMLEKGTLQSDVTISYSSDDSFADFQEETFPFDRIINPNDNEKFIFIPTKSFDETNNIAHFFFNSIEDLDIQISTGPVVDFRLKKYLQSMPDSNTVPLIYPIHFQDNGFIWPIENSKKSNAIIFNEETRKWCYPNGYYTIVRRFSSKEENKRIVANVIAPEYTNGSAYVAFENHLNVFHTQKNGLSKIIANGLAVYLNSSMVDIYFRQFSGHTQVNATDLRNLKYPDNNILKELGKWAIEQQNISQEMIDNKVEKIINVKIQDRK